MRATVVRKGNRGSANELRISNSSPQRRNSSRIRYRRITNSSRVQPLTPIAITATPRNHIHRRGNLVARNTLPIRPNMRPIRNPRISSQMRTQDKAVLLLYSQRARSTIRARLLACRRLHRPRTVRPRHTLRLVPQGATPSPSRM